MSQHGPTWGDDVPLPSIERDRRRKEVNGILAKLRRVSRGKEGEKYYLIRFLRDGIDAYVNCFDNAAIYYTSLAAELALIVRLGEGGALHEWRKKEETEVRQGKKKRESDYPSFSTLIKWAAKTGLLNGRATELGRNVRKLRNSYLHYYNVMWHQIDIDSRTRMSIVGMLPKVKKEIQQSAQPGERDEILKIIDFVTASVAEDKTLSNRRIPTRDIRPNKEAVDFIEERERSFVEQLLSLQEKGEWEQFVWYHALGVEWRDALDCLQWSADILTHLRFLQEDNHSEKTA